MFEGTHRKVCGVLRGWCEHQLFFFPKTGVNSRAGLYMQRIYSDILFIEGFFRVFVKCDRQHSCRAERGMCAAHASVTFVIESDFLHYMEVRICIYSKGLDVLVHIRR